MMKPYLSRCLRNSAFAIALLLTACWLPGQTIPRMVSPQVFENGNLLRNPGAGGFNIPEYSPIDLDGDGTLDLFAFDRAGQKIVTFLNGGTANQIDYDFAPQYADAFPAGITDFALLADYDCDGKKDLFFGTNAGIKVYHNTSTPGNLSFQLYRDTLFTDYGSGDALLYLYQGDLPALVDVDGDSDLDVLAFNPPGTTVEWHKNMVMENTGNCAGLDLVVADRCWGHFQESGLNQTLTLGISCRTAPNSPPPLRHDAHTGSSLAAFDEDADGDYELVIGDLLYDGLSYTHNAGTPAAADVDSIDPHFPSYDAPVAIDIFAAAFFLDVNNDAKTDMIAAPNVVNVSVNYDNSWYYLNLDPGNGVLLARESKNFLTSTMIDVGQTSYPVFWDYNGDGLDDLIIGNYSRKVTATNTKSSLTVYENTGTASAPAFTLVSRDYSSISSQLPPELFGFTPTFGDLDGDGDDDLILGDADGKVHFFRNTAATGQPATFTLVSQNYMGIDVGNSAAPMLIDIDRDGLLDIVLGQMTGTLNYYKNAGTAQVPLFPSNPTIADLGNVDVEPICCTGYSVPFIFTNPSTGRYDLIVGSDNGNLFYYNDFESEIGGAFTLDQSNFGEIKEGSRTAIAGKDLTGDGVWEWAVGNVRGGIGLYSGNGKLTGAHDTQPLASTAWEAFPNPSSGHLTLRIKQPISGEMRITVTDLQGRPCLPDHQRPAAQSADLDLSALAAGIYLLRLDLNGQFSGMKRIDVVK